MCTPWRLPGKALKDTMSASGAGLPSASCRRVSEQQVLSSCTFKISDAATVHLWCHFGTYSRMSESWNLHIILDSLLFFWVLETRDEENAQISFFWNTGSALLNVTFSEMDVYTGQYPQNVWKDQNGRLPNSVYNFVGKDNMAERTSWHLKRSVVLPERCFLKV